MNDYNKERLKRLAAYEFEKLTKNLLQTIKDKFFEAVGINSKALIANVGSKKEKERKGKRGEKKSRKWQKKIQQEKNQCFWV